MLTFARIRTAESNATKILPRCGKKDSISGFPISAGSVALVMETDVASNPSAISVLSTKTVLLQTHPLTYLAEQFRLLGSHPY